MGLLTLSGGKIPAGFFFTETVFNTHKTHLHEQ